MEDSSVSFRSCAYILTVHVCLACSWEAHVVVRYYSQLRVKNLVNRMAFNSISITAFFFVYVLLVRFFIFGYYSHIAVHFTCLLQYLECGCGV